MKRPFNKKRFWLIIAILALVEALVCYIAIQWKYIFPSNEVSEIYARYEKVEGIDVSFVKDYKVNDTVYVDVTLLEATDSVGWATLKKDFEVPNPPPVAHQCIDNGEDLIGVKLIPKSTTTDTILTPYPNDVLAFSHLKRSLIVFHTKNNDEVHAVIFHNFEKSINQDN